MDISNSSIARGGIRPKYDDLEELASAFWHIPIYIFGTDQGSDQKSADRLMLRDVERFALVQQCSTQGIAEPKWLVRFDKGFDLKIERNIRFLDFRNLPLGNFPAGRFITC